MNSLQFLEQNWPTYEIGGDDPYHDLWRELFHHAGYEAARDLFDLRTEQELFSRFRDAIKLADEFVQDYEESGETVDVVLLYYGAMWLGMAVALATLKQGAIEHASEVHGLQTTNLNVWPFSLEKVQLEAKDRNATFSIINEAFGGESLFERPFTLMELIRSLPDMQDSDLEKVKTDITAPHFIVDPGTRGVVLENRAVRGFVQGGPKVLNEGWLRDNLAIGHYLSKRSLTVVDAERRIIQWLPTDPRTAEAEMEQVLIRSDGTLYFLPTIGGRRVPEFSIYLMILYALSRIARYYPHIWIRMRDLQTNEFFVLRSFVRYAQRKIPLMALNHLTRRNHVFGTR